ncbi:MAG: KamA family radical SAM protein [Candidatus Bathyarchaeota archaeon]|nr:KamA family radical SAM protein [Candidatus Bathyarchaeum tardum]WNZ28432.1 MAG: KamA family radical SAM protein [Candidatus Bathyarchaeota archaeon]
MQDINLINTIEQLKEYINLSSKETKKLKRITAIHPMQVTPYYISLIDWDNPEDPIKKMAIPSVDELNLQGSYDTSGEAENTKLQGLQHKYSETALILATKRCATYCRYCFRKRLVGRRENNEIISDFKDAVEYVKNHKEINNVLISGGDPLVLPNKIIKSFLKMLSKVSHLDFVRFGSRTLVTFPSRFQDDELLEILAEYSSPERRLYVVTQFNHPRETTKQSTEAVDKLLKAGVVVNNQTVLLRGINDNPQTLAELQNRLVRTGVNPYYVFQCRPVKRVKHHFQVPLCKGVKIVEEAKKQCNGHSKRFKYIMSHRTGKIEILGIFGNEMYFKYHEAKERKKLGKIFNRPVDEKTGWLNDSETSVKGQIS